MFDDDDSKSLGFREFLCCFSVLLRGTIQEKLDLFIKMHDVEKKGYFFENEVEKTIDDVC
jgi:Ca2+-binding EF-hand superfamily protein